MAERLEIIINGDAQPFVKALKSAETRLDNFNAKVTQSNRAITNLTTKIKAAGTAVSSLAKNVTKLNSNLSASSTAAKNVTNTLNSLTATAARLQRNFSSLSLSMRNFNSSVRSAANSVGRMANPVNQAGLATRAFAGHQNSMIRGFRQTVVALSSLQTLFYQYSFFLGGFVATIIHVNAEYERQFQLLKNLSHATSDTLKAAEAKSDVMYLWNLAAHAPFSLESLTDSFVKLKIAGLDPTSGSLKTLADAAASAGKGSEELKLATLAIQQMVGKGVISMEELRRQLGEQIPDAMKSMAAGMKLSMADLQKEVKNGNVEATSAVQKMLDELQLRHKGAAESMMNTWNGLMAQMQTAFQKFIVNISQADGTGNKGIFFQTLKKEIQDLTNFLNTPAGFRFANDINQGLSTIVLGLANVIKFLYQWRDTIITVVKIALVYWIGSVGVRTIAGLATAFLGVVGPIAKFALALNAGKGVMLALGFQSATLGLAIQKLASNFGLAANSSRQAAASLALFGLKAFGIIGAVALATAAIWKMVEAQRSLNRAKADAADLDARIKRGEVLTQDEINQQRSRIRQNRSMVGAKKLANVGRMARGLPPVYSEEELRKDEANISQLEQKINTAQQNLNSYNFDATVDNYVNGWKKVRDKQTAAIQQTYTNRIAAIEAGEKDEKKKTKLLAEAGAQVRQDMVKYWTYAYQRGKQEEAAAIKSGNKIRIAAVKKANQEWGKELEQAQGVASRFDAPNVLAGGKDDKGNKGNKGPKSDGLDGLRSTFTNLTVESQRLKAELAGTLDEFDEMGANDAAQEQAAKLTSKDGLKDAIVGLRVQIRGLKDDLKFQKLDADLGSLVEQSTEEANKALDDYARNFDTIKDQIAKEAVQVNKQFKALFDPQRRSAEEIAASEVKRNEVLTQKKIELIAREGKAFRDKNEEIEQSEMTNDQLREYLYQRERERVLQYIEAAKAVGTATSQQLADAIKYLERLDRKNEEAKKGPIFQWAKQAALDFKNLKDNIGNSFVGALDGFIDELSRGKFAFKQFALAILSDLAKIIIRAVIAKVILSALGLGSGSFGNPGSTEGMTDFSNMGSQFPSGAISFGTDHTGGTVGNERTFKSVNPGIFAFAKRYHNGGFPGLNPNEVPIIAERGEGVFTREQMKALGGGGAAPNVTVNVINQSGQDVEAEKKAPRFDGERWVTDIVLKNMKKAGPMRDHLEGLRKK